MTSFELQLLYPLVSNRPLLMVVILAVALGVEWLLERYEEDDNGRPARTEARSAGSPASAARSGACCCLA